MHVIGQHDPAIDMKRTCRSNLSHRRAQCLDLVDEQATLTFQQINYEDIRSSRNAIAVVVGDGRILPEPMSVHGGRRCAFPPYGPKTRGKPKSQRSISTNSVFVFTKCKNLFPCQIAFKHDWKIV